MSNSLRSHWLHGTIRHRRFSPVDHRFQYRTGMLAINLDEWDAIGHVSGLFSLERFNWISLFRQDYFAPQIPSLKQAVADRVEQAMQWRPDGPIYLITHPRYLGRIFNPVSFYFCYESGKSPEDDSVPRAICAEITNTPWGERHLYCMDASTVQSSTSGWQYCQFRFDKRFHVSPYNAMDQNYHWTFSFADGETRIHMMVAEAGKTRFDATLNLERTPLSRKSLHKHLRRFPLETLKVVAGIYWHALLLKVKGARFYDHPANDPNGDVGRKDSGENVQHQNESTGKVTSWRT